MKIRIGAILICILLIASSLVIIYPIKAMKVNGNTLYVGGDGPGNYTRIQDAIDNASDGDTVFVYNGDYPENVNINKSIIFLGEDKYSTKIKGIFIRKNETHIYGFTIQNGSYHDINNENSEGISIYSCNNVISNNIITLNYYGIYFGISSYNKENTISNNTIYKNNHGIGEYWSGPSSSNKIYENNIFDQINWGIITSGNKNYIFNNTIENNRGGIFLQSDYNTIIENKIIDNKDDGIYLEADWRHDNIIFGNEFVGTSIRLDGTGTFLHNEIKNNIINGKPLVYLESESNKIIDYETGQIILVDCNNVQITNQDISNISRAIELWYCRNCIVSNCSVSNTDVGIFILYSDNNLINNNSISYNSDGIFLEDSDRNNINYNIFNNNGNGLFLYFIYYVYQSESNKITYNNFIENNIGIRIFDCWPNTYCYNNFIKNKKSLSFSLPIHPTNNNFDYNYWDRPRTFPMVIFDINWWLFIPIPRFIIDWHPATEPYDIP